MAGRIPEVTRLEVIDETGRVYTQWDCEVEYEYQDGDRTLKLFVTKGIPDGSR